MKLDNDYIEVHSILSILYIWKFPIVSLKNHRLQLSLKMVFHYAFNLLPSEYFKNLFTFQLKDNCFTEFCCFLSNLNMNQP